MIYVTGDCHGNFERFTTAHFPVQRTLTKDDIVMITGDFGGIWFGDCSSFRKEEDYWLKWLMKKPFTVLFVDGNHENFDRLYSYPVREYCGGFVHEIGPNMMHLMRGQVYHLQGRTFFAFGGASSHDMEDGVLEPDDKRRIDRFYRQGKRFRIRGESWWEEELPTEEEMETGIRNLERHNWKVDYVISHCCPTSVLRIFNQENKWKEDVLTDYFDTLLDRGLTFDNWMFGHYHQTKEFDGGFQMLYEAVERLL